MNAAALLLPIGGSVFRVMKKAVNALDAAGDAGRTLKNGANAAEAATDVGKASGVGDVAAKGGVYKLVDPSTGQVMKTGRTNNLARRAAEHARDPDYKDFQFKTIFKSDNPAERRGLEQIAHKTFNPPLDKINGIDPTNPNRNAYLKAAQDFLGRYGVTR